MKRIKRKKLFDIDYEKKTLRAGLIDADSNAEDWDKKELMSRAAYFLLNDTPEFSVNQTENGRYRLLASDKDFYAAKSMGVTEFTVRVYRFTEKNAEIFSCVEKLKNERLTAMEEGYLMQRLVKDYALT